LSVCLSVSLILDSAQKADEECFILDSIHKVHEEYITLDFVHAAYEEYFILYSLHKAYEKYIILDSVESSRRVLHSRLFTKAHDGYFWNLSTKLADEESCILDCVRKAHEECFTLGYVHKAYKEFFILRLLIILSHTDLSSSAGVTMITTTAMTAHHTCRVVNQARNWLALSTCRLAMTPGMTTTSNRMAHVLPTMAVILAERNTPICTYSMLDFLLKL